MLLQIKLLSKMRLIISLSGMDAQADHFSVRLIKPGASTISRGLKSSSVYLRHSGALCFMGSHVEGSGSARAGYVGPLGSDILLFGFLYDAVTENF